MGKVKLARFVYKQEFKLRPGRHELEGKATMREWTQGIKGGPDHYWGAFSLPNILLANSSLFTSQKNKNQVYYFFEKIRSCRVQSWRLEGNMSGYTCMQNLGLK